MGTVIGVDIGQRRDPTAICVAETQRRPSGKATEEHYLIRHLERLPLGTPYPEVARRLAEIATRTRERGRDTPRLYLDATGVGQPVVDVLRADVSVRSTARPLHHGGEVGAPQRDAEFAAQWVGASSWSRLAGWLGRCSKSARR